MFPSSHFDDQQKRVVFHNSKEYKELEKARQNAQKRAYYEDLAWQKDEAYDGSDSQAYEPEEKDE